MRKRRSILSAGGNFRSLLRGLALCLLHLSCYLGRGALPQAYIINSWRGDDELPRDGIISIAQGADNYLWVSSRYGLARFDGLRFVGVGPQLSGVFLGYHYANLTTDPAGNVWLGIPGGGLLRWREGRLESLLAPGNPVFGPVIGGLTNAAGRELALTPDGRVLGWAQGAPELVATATKWGDPVPYSVCQDQQGSLWFVTYQHRLVHVSGTNVQEITFGVGEERRNWIALQAAASGQLVAGTHRGLGVWKGANFEPINSPTEPFPVDDIIACRGSRDIAATNSMPGRGAGGDRVWVIALGHAWLREGDRWIADVPFESAVGQYETSPRIVDRQDNLWFSGTKAAIARAGTDGTLLTLGAAEGVPPGRVAALCEDREGSIWAGIEHAGLVRLRERWFTPLGTHDGLRAPLVWAALEDSTGAIWLGTENNGLQSWKQGKFTAFNLGNAGLPGSVYSLCVDSGGRVWAGTGENGIFVFENGKFVPVWEYAKPGWNKRVYVLHEDRQGRMWFGTGMGVFAKKDGEVQPCLAKGLEMGVPHCMAEQSNGGLWVGTSGGAETRLFRWDPTQASEKGAANGRFVSALENEPRLLGVDVFALHADSDGSVWIGTLGKGLWRWRDGRFSQYGLEEGLPDLRIHSIADDGAGFLWLGSPTGIFRLSKQSVAELDSRQTDQLKCLIYNRTDGLPTRECTGGSQPSVWQMRDGGLLFAMAEGAVMVAPRKIRMNGVPPTVVIEQIRVDGKALPLPHISDISAVRPGAAGSSTKPLLLSPGHHAVEFQYTATSLISPSKVKFKCRLEGVEPDWREADPSRSEMYNLTSPGTYRFCVTACNNDGVWNATGTRVNVKVLPHVWQTWWFQVGLAGGVAGSIGAGIRFIERRKIKRRMEQLEMLHLVDKERARIARDIHDDLGASLTEIGLLSEFAQRDSSPAEQVKEDMRGVAAKARSCTRALDEIVWAVNPRNDTLEGFVTYTCAYAQEQLRLLGIRCRLEVPSPVPRVPLRADLRHHLFLAFKEALHNVLKHAQASEVEIRMAMNADTLTLTLTDNGRGFELKVGPRAMGENGLTNMKERLEAIGGSCEYATGPGRGTRVTMRLPLT